MRTYTTLGSAMHEVLGAIHVSNNYLADYHSVPMSEARKAFLREASETAASAAGSYAEMYGDPRAENASEEPPSN